MEAVKALMLLLMQLLKIFQAVFSVVSALEISSN